MFNRSIYHISINIRYIKPYITPKKWNLSLEKRLSAASPLSWWERDVVSPQGARKQGATRAPAPGDLLILSTVILWWTQILAWWLIHCSMLKNLWMFNFIELLLGCENCELEQFLLMLSRFACQPQVRTWPRIAGTDQDKHHAYCAGPLRTKFYWFAIMRINLVMNIRIDMSCHSSQFLSLQQT